MQRIVRAGCAGKSQILHIVMRSLGYMDRRLVAHGERVAYIADRIARADGSLDIDMDKLLILCLLHDIGAYKTEEIDDMLRFESDDVQDHAVYGYVFLKNATALPQYAEAVLYHHTRYDQLVGIDTPYKDYAALIHLADRIDVLLLSSSGPAVPDALRRLSGTVFSPALVERYFEAEAAYDISGHIRDGSYLSYVEARIDEACHSDAEVASYLSMLVHSIDFRSPYTVTHTANTAAISVWLAELFGLGGAELEAVRLGAFLHDIGKIAIPYSILENPGRLTEEQMNVMKTHVAFSEEILSGIVPDEVKRIAVRHHEKLNGTGYCRGLGAQELSRAERIVAVADILSALIDRRSYKEPFTKEMTIDILTRMRDAGEICPEVSNMAIARYDDILRITEQADDPVLRLYETIKSQYAEYAV